VAIALARQMLYRNSAKDHPLEAHKVDSLAIYYLSLKDGKEGVQSFLEKRAPAYVEVLRNAAVLRGVGQGRVAVYPFCVKYAPFFN